MILGWVKLHRQLLDSSIFASAELLRIFVWCLLKANHKKAFVPIKTGKGESIVEVGVGQFIFGRKKAAKELGDNGNTIYKRMQKLKTMGICNIQSNTHYSIVTIVNWDKYQVDDSESNRQSNNQVTTKCQPSNTNKKDKNVNNDKKTTDESFEKFWLRMPRKEKKKDCRTKWKYIPKKNHDKIHKALDKIIPIWDKKEKQFIPHPLTWLNGERWDDEVECEDKVSEAELACRRRDGK